jgi:site-specific DNA-methyltransferase (cytosine-N4-specific)
VDANPLATLIARVKCRPLSDKERQAVNAATQEAERLVAAFYDHDTTNGERLQLNLFQSTLRSVQPQIPDIPDLDFWFPAEAINELALLKQAIDGCGLERAREFLQVAFSSIIVNVSYQDSDTRYTRREKGLKGGDTLKKWLAKVTDMLDRVHGFDQVAPLGRVRTLAMDARRLSGIEPESVALAVTSPPYPNAYSYHLYHRYRMLWLDMDQPRFKQEEIGSHRKYSAKQNGATVDTFRAEMTAVLRAVREALRSSALCVLVVGDSIVRGEVVRNDRVICEAGEAAGLHHLVTLQRNIHSGKKAFNPVIGKIRHEHLIFLRRP